jgi:hypothetical protein
VDSGTVINISTGNDFIAWLNFFVTTLAMIAAGWAGWQARGLLIVEIARDKSRELTEEKRYANKISCWARPELKGFTSNSYYNSRGVGGEVRNYSDQAIYDVCLSWISNGEIVYESKFDLIPPGESLIQELPKNVLIVVSKDENFFDIIESEEAARQASQEVCDSIRIAIQFRDAENRTWKRDSLGFLSKI